MLWGHHYSWLFGRKKKLLINIKKLAILCSVFLGICLGSQNPASTLMKSLPKNTHFLQETEFQRNTKNLIIRKEEQTNKKAINNSQKCFLVKFYETAYIQVKEKWVRMKDDPQIFFILLLLTDILFFAVWFKRLQCLKIIKLTGFSQASVVKRFLIIIITVLSGATLIYSDSVGNLTRYTSPIFFLLMIFLVESKNCMSLKNNYCLKIK